MANGDDTPIEYFADIRELRTIPTYFAKHGAVSMFRREPTVTEGSPIHGGQKLGAIVWEAGGNEPLFAPANCNGTIAQVNGQMQYEFLKSTSQYWLRVR